MEKLLYIPARENGNFKLCMAYPSKEEFALSSLGYMWLYKIADSTTGISTVKICTDSEVFPFYPDAVAFSMSFDFDFMGVFEILEKCKIPFLSSQRNETYPLIFAGGPAITTNPEPMIQVFDFVITGDGETSFEEVLNILKEKYSKAVTLKKLSKLAGVFVPGINTTVKKNTVPLEDVIYTPIISEKSYFKDTFVIEIARGCMNRCAFCTASYLNLPFRSYPYEKIINSINLGLKYTNKIALLGAQISAHPDFNKIIEYIEEKIESGNNIELGISSLRTDAITPQMIRTLVKGGQRTSTIAIEAASERLRKLINKNLKEEQILNAVKISRENGLKGLKIYSMIGIPTETQEDIEEFITLAKKIKTENKSFNIAFSFSTFVPKPHTPFQWCKREDTKSLEIKQKYLEKELSKLGVETKFSSIKWDYWQTVISRGDRSLTPYLIEVYKKGGKNGAYKSLLKDFNININKSVGGFDFEETLPWDYIDTYPPKQQLLNEYYRLMKNA